MDEEYIPIQLPFSEDKELGGESDATTGIFPTLSNYIVGNKVLKTRKGITELAWAGSGYTPSDDPNVLIHLRFEYGVHLDCEINGAGYMSVTAGGSICASTTDFVEGAAALKIDSADVPGGTDLNVYKKNNTLPGGFPGQGGTGDCIISFWHRTFRTAGGIDYAIIKHDAESLAGGFNIRSVESGPSRTWEYRITNSAGSTGNYNTSVVVNTIWTHFGLWSCKTLNKCGLVIYNRDTKVENQNSQNSSIGGTAANGSNQLWVCLDRSNAGVMMDDFIVQNEVFSTEAEIIAKIQLMRSRGT